MCGSLPGLAGDWLSRPLICDPDTWVVDEEWVDEWL
jgi:hypothetical protein